MTWPCSFLRLTDVYHRQVAQDARDHLRLLFLGEFFVTMVYQGVDGYFLEVTRETSYSNALPGLHLGATPYLQIREGVGWWLTWHLQGLTFNQV